MLKKRILSVLIVVLTLSLSAGLASARDAESRFSVGVLQLVEHASLDAAYEGFVAGLAEAGFVVDENLTIDFQNAQADQSNMVTISERFVKNKVDLILAIATPAAQAVAAATTEIPIVFTAVTDPVEARLVETLEAPRTNITSVNNTDQIGRAHV